MESLACWQQRAREPQQVCELGRRPTARGFQWSHWGLQLRGRPPVPAPPACLSSFRYLAIDIHPRSGMSFSLLLTSGDSSQAGIKHQGNAQHISPPGASWTSPQILQCPSQLSLSIKRLNGGQHLPVSREFPLLAPARCAASRDGPARLPRERALPLLPNGSPGWRQSLIFSPRGRSLNSSNSPSPLLPPELQRQLCSPSSELTPPCPPTPAPRRQAEAFLHTLGNIRNEQPPSSILPVVFSPLRSRDALRESVIGVASILKMRILRLRREPR